MLHGGSRRGWSIGVGMRKWKQANLRPLMGTLPQSVAFAANARALAAKALDANDRVVCWGATMAEDIAEVASRSGAAKLRMEDGFIRSVGLGSDLIPPLSVVFDDQGIYFDPNRPSRLETILNEAEFSDAELDEAARLRDRIVADEITKYNMEPRQEPAWTCRGRRIVLVPGQVEDDASIQLGCPGIRTNLALLRATREACPDAFIVYKPHPDVWSGNRKGAVHRQEALALADHVETDVSVVSCIAAAHEVQTLTSLTGFDALLRGKSVTTYGEPFYAGWGLSTDRAGRTANLSRRRRKLTHEQLIAGTLLRYPVYWDEALRGYTNAAATVAHIIAERARLEASGGLQRMRHGYLRRQYRRASIVLRAAFRH